MPSQSFSTFDECQRSSQSWTYHHLLCVRQQCDLKRKVSAISHLLQMVHLICTILSSSKFNCLFSCRFWKCPSCCILASPGVQSPPTRCYFLWDILPHIPSLHTTTHPTISPPMQLFTLTLAYEFPALLLSCH